MSYANQQYPPQPPPAPIASGKTKGCCMGCGIAVAIAVVIIVVAGFAGWKWFTGHFDFAFVDVANKTDLPTDATRDELLPVHVGEFTRDDVSTETSIMTGPGQRPATVPGNPNTSGTFLMGTYKNPQGQAVFAYAVPSHEARDLKVGENGNMHMQGAMNVNRGVKFAVKNGTQKLDSVIWAKPHWTYFVQTTATQALDFVEKFQPGK